MQKSEIESILEYRDGKLYWKKSRGRIKIGAEAGTVNTAGYVVVTINQKKFLAHRLIFALHHGYYPKYIDHDNRDKLDNRIENLRACTQSENMRNATIRRSSRSGLKNVTWSNQCKKWVVHLTLNERLTHIGVFEDKELAALVALEARDKYYGQFARTV